MAVEFRWSVTVGWGCFLAQFVGKSDDVLLGLESFWFDHDVDGEVFSSVSPDGHSGTAKPCNNYYNRSIIR